MHKKARSSASSSSSRELGPKTLVRLTRAARRLSAPSSRRWRVAAVALVGIAVVFGARSSFVQAAPPPCPNGTTLNVVAHEDDDLLFLSPDLLHDIQNNRCVDTVYTTAGDAGDVASYWQGREDGVEAAYAAMAGVPDSWTPSTLSVTDSDHVLHSISMETLAGDTNVSLIFLRLPDGSDNGNGFASDNYESLKKLWTGNSSTRIHPVDGSSPSGYSKAGLTSTLTALMNQFQPDIIRTQDYVNTGVIGSNDDHSDHQATGLFTYTAQQTYATTHTIIAYLDYDSQNYPQNVYGADLTAKQNAFYQYGADDSHVDCYSSTNCDATYAAWLKNQYTVPYANAGPNRMVTTGASVQLLGSTSFDVYGKTLSYHWTQTGGPSVSLSSQTVANPSFTAPTSDAALTFALTVGDGVASSTDSVTITVVEETENIADQATVTASSQDTADDEGADKAVDGYTDGEPLGDPTHEWATLGKGAGSWLQLNWGSAQAIDHVVLYDRPNPQDQITGATLSFSSGGNVAVPSLNNDGSPVTVNFPARSTTMLRLTINSVSSSTLNIGLAEIEVWTDHHPVANAGSDQSVNTSTPGVTLDASASTDASPDDTLSYLWTQTGGTPVTLSSTSAIQPTFTAPASASTLSFTVTVSDGVLSDADSVTINVPDRSPVAHAGPDQTVNTSDPVQLDGSASSDPDLGDTLSYLWQQQSGTPVTLSSDTAAQPTFTAPGSASTLVFKLTVSDGTLSDNDSVTINVPDRAPVANAGPDQTVNTSTSVTLDGSSSSDPDLGDTLSYLWQQTGGTAVTLSSDTAAQPTFTAPGSASTLTFQLTVSDGTLNDTDSVTINVPDRAPVANAGPDQTVNTSTSVTLDGSASSDPDVGDTLSYLWEQTGGTAVTLSSTSAKKPTFTAPTKATTLTFKLTVSDGTLSDNDSVTINVPDRAPVAHAGPDQSVNTSDPVQLDGSASSDPDLGDTLTYLWEQTGGTTVSLSSDTVAKPTFTAPTQATTLTFKLTVSDGTLSDNDSVTINVPDRAPVANAGPDQIVNTSTSVTLDGSASSDPDVGDTLSYLWAQTGGTTVTLSSTSAKKPTFTTPGSASTLTFKLTVSDGTLSNTDYVTITVPDRAPVANAGPDQNATTSTTVMLDGSSSYDPDLGDSLTYAWLQTGGGPSVSLVGADTTNPTFTAPATAGTLTFKLTVSDGTLSDNDSVTITVNRFPTADAGPDQNVNAGDTVMLDGTSSSADPSRLPLSYKWTQTGGSTTVTLSSDTAANPTFTAPAGSASLTFKLTVTDNGALSSSDSVTIYVNRPPVADAGPDQSVNTGASVTLDGSSSSDPDHDALSYKWTQTGGPTVSLSSSTAAQPTFTAPGSASTLTFKLTVSDGKLSNTDSVTINVPDRAPVANAGPDQSVNASSPVQLDASASNDPDKGDTLSYLWAQTSGTPVTLSSTTAQKPTFTAPASSASLTFKLTVSDGKLSSTDSVSITVVKKTTPAVKVYKRPQTKLVKATILPAQLMATFTFSGSLGKGKLSFQCKLDKGKYKSCRSGKSYTNLKPGKHVFQVRAKDSSGKVDPTPVTKKFKI